MKKSIFRKLMTKKKTRNDIANTKPSKNKTPAAKNNFCTTLETSPSTDSESTYSSSTADRYSPTNDSMSSRNHTNQEDVALADKEMEERANRAKELLSMRYKGMRHEQVS